MLRGLPHPARRPRRPSPARGRCRRSCSLLPDHPFPDGASTQVSPCVSETTPPLITPVPAGHETVWADPTVFTGTSNVALTILVAPTEPAGPAGRPAPAGSAPGPGGRPALPFSAFLALRAEVNSLDRPVLDVLARHDEGRRCGRGRDRHRDNGRDDCAFHAASSRLDRELERSPQCAGGGCWWRGGGGGGGSELSRQKMSPSSVPGIALTSTTILFRSATSPSRSRWTGPRMRCTTWHSATCIDACGAFGPAARASSSSCLRRRSWSGRERKRSLVRA